ncbi:hypothetical protein GGI1_21754, partial [Acidithiobacillus sp. GGI-221]
MDACSSEQANIAYTKSLYPDPLSSLRQGYATLALILA